MRCLFRHKWFVGKVVGVNVTSYVKAALYYRTCSRCGTMQRGFDSFDGEIPWETMRERSYRRAQEIPIFRKHSFPLDRLAHSLGVRRSRTSDGTRSGNSSALTSS